MKHIYIPIDLYASGVHFLITKDKEKAKRFAEKHFGSAEPLGDSDGACWSEKGQESVIWLEKMPCGPETHGILAHEVLHAVLHVMRTVEMRFSEDSEEAYTYLLGYIIEQFLRKVRRKRQE